LRDIRVANRRGFTNPPETQTQDVEERCKEVGATIKIYKPNLNWMFGDILKELVDLDFVDEIRYY